MRFRKLDLLKFGRFDGASIDLPGATSDLHIVYGDNEAGKSTTLAALEYLLFGFPSQTPFNFRFKNPQLRIGATLQSPAGEFDLIRRKGSKDTLINADGQPLIDGEKRLAGILEGANQAFYRRYFLLDDQRLRDGAGELLETAGDAGETLLASGAGIHGLMDILAGYNDHADSLWGKTNKASREFAIANKRLKEAVAEQKAAQTNHSSYRTLQRDFEAAQKKYLDAQAGVRALQARQAKLGRIRRVHFDVQALIASEQDIVGIGDIPELPADAAARFADAERRLQASLDRRESYLEQHARLAAAAEGVTVDEQLLLRGDDINALVEARLVALGGRNELPALAQHALALDESIAGIARDLGWEPFDVANAAQKIVPVPVVEDARALAVELVRSREREEAGKNKLEDARNRLDEYRAFDVDAVSEEDSTALRAALSAANAESEVAGRRESAEETCERLERALAGLLAGLSPAVADAFALRATSVPARAELETHREVEAKLVQRLDALRDDLQRARQSLAEDEQQQTSAGKSVGAMTDLELAALREERDTALDLLMRRYVQGETIVDADWREVFDTDAIGEHHASRLVAQADLAADTRLANADEVASSRVLLGRIEAGQAKVLRLEQELLAAESALAEQAASWASLWSASGVVPGTVEQMLRWYDQRDVILQRLAELEDARVQVERYKTKEAELVASLSGAMTSFVSAISSSTSESLPAVRARATQILTELDNAQAQHQSRATGLIQAQAQFDQAQSAHTQLVADGDALAGRWQSALEALQLPAAIAADKIEPYLRLVEQYRARVDEVSAIRLRQIGKIEADIVAFEQQAAALAKAIAPDLQAMPADDLTLALAARKDAEQRSAEWLVQNTVDRDAVQQALDRLLQDSQDSEDALAELHQLAGTSEPEALKQAIDRSERLRAQKLGVAEIVDRLQANGDGKSVAELRSEVEGMDLDEVSAEDQQLSSDLPAREDELNELRDRSLAARKLFEQIGSSGDAAAAAGRVQSAYADMETIAESFVRARTSERLLRWGIDHFRKRKQGPLLDKASSLFRTATGGAYEKLVVDYEGDSPVLAGVDQESTQKRVDAMSDGTRDQLYLALRLAAVEDYIERAEPMPFVADDIFVHFDDARTGYALKALEDLSTRCQVVVFTHHRRLLEIAEAVLSTKPNMVML